MSSLKKIIHSQYPPLFTRETHQLISSALVCRYFRIDHWWKL